MTCKGCPFFRYDLGEDGYYCGCNGELVKICDAGQEPVAVPSCPWFGDEEEEE